MNYRIVTTTDNDRITQALELDVNDVRETLWRRVIDLSEQHIRDALVRLGWTPPQSGKKEDGSNG